MFPYACIRKLIWKEGYTTDNSCQDINDGKVWIEFRYIDDFHEILQKAHTYDMRVNVARITHL
jgi:hypothetical protein